MKAKVNGHFRTTTKAICEVCGKEFNARIEKSGTQRFCSKQCFYNKQDIKVEVKCFTCEKIIKKYPSHFNRASKHFCSVECSNNNPEFKKKYKDKEGYMLIKAPNHQHSNSRGYVREHRLVMEKFLGRILIPHNELVHHKNGIKDDNCIDNLELVLQNPHSGKVNCPYCEREFSIR